MNKIIFQVILIIISVGLFFTVIDPMYRSADPAKPGIETIKKEIADYDVAIDNSDKFVREKNKLLEEKNNLNQDDRNRLERLLPDSIDNIRLVIGINDIARPYGLVLKSLRFSGNTSKGGEDSGEEREIAIGGNEVIGSVTLGFSVSAKYEVFKQFLKSLESSLRLADVTNVSVRSGAGDVYDYDITIKTYWLR